MPMYHGTGALTGMVCLMGGVSIAISKGFSVRNFWRDVRDSESTFIVYVGETARYLLAAPHRHWIESIRCGVCGAMG